MYSDDMYIKNKEEIKSLVKTYYEFIGADRLVSALKKYSKNQGYGIEAVGCSFANEFNEWEEDYFGESGVAYYFDYPVVEKECIAVVTNEEFFKYLSEVCENYLKINNDGKKEIEDLLEKVRANLKINVEYESTN